MHSNGKEISIRTLPYRRTPRTWTNLDQKKCMRINNKLAKQDYFHFKLDYFYEIQ